MACSPPRNSGWLLAAVGKPCSSALTGMAMVTSHLMRFNPLKAPGALRGRLRKKLLPVGLARVRASVKRQRPVGAAPRHRGRAGRMPRSAVPETNRALGHLAGTAQIPERRASCGGKVLEVALAIKRGAPPSEVRTHCYADGSVGAVEFLSNLQGLHGATRRSFEEQGQPIVARLALQESVKRYRVYWAFTSPSASAPALASVSVSAASSS